ncbi:MAG: TetR/AcrR family transcriptional regulator [Proteobacteria bacterium]|nr:TetR/AcrR family transcriptional regulator [Pseudomonadota bacterium]
MAAKATDRRTLRTRVLLRDALITLILKKDYDAITVKDIIDQANVGRSTFYAHYKSKEALFRGGFEKLRTLLVEHQRSALAERGNADARRLGFSRAMFEHARDHTEIYRALVRGRGGIVALGEIRRVLSELVREDLTATLARNGAGAAHRELVVQYVVGAFMAVLTWWLDRRARLPPAEVDALFRALTLRGIAPADDDAP